MNAKIYNQAKQNRKKNQPFHLIHVLLVSTYISTGQLYSFSIHIHTLHKQLAWIVFALSLISMFYSEIIKLQTIHIFING